MAILNCHFPTKLQVFASSALPSNSASSPSPQSQYKYGKLPITSNSNVKLQQEKLKVQQPSILEIERAIGAGIFRDTDTNREAEESNSLFETVLKNSVGKSEGSVEKELRKTGEWLIDQTERTSRSAGKQILVTMFIWILPIWMVSFLVASGAVQLPFDIPFLKDILS